jgi:hypothetical protein
MNDARHGSKPWPTLPHTFQKKPVVGRDRSQHQQEGRQRSGGDQLESIEMHGSTFGQPRIRDNDVHRSPFPDIHA